MRYNMLTLIWPLLDLLMSSKVKGLNINWKIINDFVYAFHRTMAIEFTMSEILAQIDYKGPNWTILTLKMTFRVIPHLSYFRTEFVSHQSSHTMQYLDSTSLLLNNIDNYGKMVQNRTFTTMKMTFWIIQSNPSLDSWPKNSKTAKFDPSLTIRTLKYDL